MVIIEAIDAKKRETYLVFRSETEADRHIADHNIIEGSYTLVGMPNNLWKLTLYWDKP